MAASERGVTLFWLDADRLLFYLGRGTERTLEAFTVPSQTARGMRALFLALLGRHEEAHAIRARFTSIESDDDESSAHAILALFEAAILGGDADTARALSPRLASFADGLAGRFGGSIARLLGDAAVLLGQPANARAYYEQALDVCAKVRFRSETAITRLHVAELLLGEAAGGQPSAVSPGVDEGRLTAERQAEGSRHLDFAIEEFRAMKMQPYLERALRHKGLLRA